MTAEGKERDRVQGRLGEGDEVEADAVIEHPFGGKSEEMFRDFVEGGAGGENENFESCALEIAVDPVLFE